MPSPERPDDYPALLSGWLAAVPAAERDEDGRQLSAALERLSTLGGQQVLVTHAFVVAWFVRAALAAPVAAWTSIDVANTGLTTLPYESDRHPRVIAVNDTGHLLR